MMGGMPLNAQRSHVLRHRDRGNTWPIAAHIANVVPTSCDGLRLVLSSTSQTFAASRFDFATGEVAVLTGNDFDSIAVAAIMTIDTLEQFWFS